MDVTYDSGASFVAAVSLLAALEGLCVSAPSTGVLPYLGMARAELTDFGQRLPSHFEELEDVSLDGGLEQLDALLTQMLSRSCDLSHTLRIRASREILREGRT